MTRAGVVCMSVGVKDGICSLNTKQNGRAEWEERVCQGLPGSMLVFLNHNLSMRNCQIMWHMMTCAPIGTSKIPLFPQHMFHGTVGPDTHRGVPQSIKQNTIT